MHKCLSTVCFILTFVALFGQEGTNPFDVRGRQSNDAQNLNANTEIESSAENNLEPSNNTKERLTNAPAFDNPFEVSHVPLRQNQLALSNKSSIKLKEAPKEANYYLPLSIVLLSTILLGFVIFKDNGLLKNIFMSLNNRNFARGFRRDYKNGLSIMLLYVIFFVNISLFVFLVAKHIFKVELNNFLWILGIGVVLYLSRHILLKFLGWLFDISDATDPYNFMILIANISIGLLLIPINLFLGYGPDILFKILILIALVLVFIIFVFRYYRGWLVTKAYRRDSLLHFFLYFCSFEIVPFLLGLKILGLF